MATTKHHIYLVCRGTSTDDIIKSINEHFEMEKKSLSKKLWGNIKNNSSNINLSKVTKLGLDEFSPLEEIGIKEMYLCKDNETIKNINEDRLKIYTSLELSSIESGFILSVGKQNGTVITPLPYLSNNKNINKKSLNEFITKFGRKINKSTNAIKYWNTKKVGSFLDIKTPLSINWNNVVNDKNPSNILLKYPMNQNLGEFKKIFENDLLNDYKTVSDVKNKPLPTAVVITDSDFIDKFLRSISQIYNKNYNIERGSVWKIDFDLKLTLDSSADLITKKEFKYIKFEKMYPIEINFLPLKFIDPTTFKFDFNGMSYNLFNARNNIPLNYINGMNFIRLSPEKQEAIKKMINILQNLRSNNTKTRTNKQINSLQETKHYTQDNTEVIQKFSFDS